MREWRTLIKMNKKDIQTREQAKEFIYNLKSRVAKDNALKWFMLNKGWYL